MTSSHYNLDILPIHRRRHMTINFLLRCPIQRPKLDLEEVDRILEGVGLALEFGEIFLDLLTWVLDFGLEKIGLVEE